MNKAVLLVVLAFVGITVAQLSTCGTQYKCAAAGTACGGLLNATNNLAGAKQISVCPDGQFCNYNVATSAGGTCQNYIAIGQSCPSGTVCADNAYCASGTCAANKYASTLGQACVSGTDKSNGCVAGLACIASVCAQLPQNGAACTGACFGANSCIGQKCVAWGSVASGGACSFPGSYDCAAGLFCNTTSTAGAYACVAPAAASGAQCNSTGSFGAGTCSAAEECGCANAGTDLSAKCFAPVTFSQSDLNTLINAANCNAKNCAQNNELCGGCGGCSALNIISSKGAQTTPNNQCATCSSGAMVAASLVFAVVAAFFAL